MVALDVFPAPAGINRLALTVNLMMNCVPRASGDKPPGADRESDDELCSPRQRG
ncbi:TPA: hypothetical protein JL218_002354 [Escherichia coli]|nr:hypothetical protein [Escherichia coli]